jgi:A/G-specific adenine glycosylase
MTSKSVSVLTGTRNEALLNWYSSHKRDLPWRLSNDPYRVLVSEVMLQQTQVERAIDRFERFISRWPSVHDLAAATNDEVLSEWSGLGYNSRALRLRDSARIISETGWPDTVSDLNQLPGVGPYTAAAVGSIAFGEHVAAVDTNLKRVISRWRGEALNGQALERAAEEELGNPAGDWNQALMDLGSQLCTPRNPSCGQCPVSAWCTDPSIYEPPTPQPTFTGSNRELRGALVKAHLNKEDLYDAGVALGRSEGEIEQVIEDLSNEGLIAQDS